MAGALHNFFLQSLLSYRGLFMWLNPMGYVSNVVFRPMLFVAIFGLVGRYAQNIEAAEAYIIGMSAYSIPLILQGGIIQSMAYDRGFGTLSVNFVSAGNRLALFLSRGVMHLPNGIFSFLSSLLAAWLILGMTFEGANWIVVMESALVVTLSCGAFALFVGTLAIAFRDFFTIGPATNGLILGLTGVILPIELLPGGLSLVGQVLPLSHGLEALRAGFAGSSTGVGDHLLIEAAVGIAYVTAGYAMFRASEWWLRRRGTLEGALG